MFFESIQDIIEASEEQLRPLIGRRFTNEERDLVRKFFFHYFDIPEEEPVIITKRTWMIFSNRLVILFEEQIKKFDNLLDEIVLLKQADPNVIFGYTEDGMTIHDFNDKL